MVTIIDKAKKLLKTSPKYVYLIAIGGHVASGKTAFTDRLIEGISLENVLIQFTRNYKLRPLRPSEIDGIDYDEIKDEETWNRLRNESEIPIEFERDGVKYGFKKSLLTALEENDVHQIVNLNIVGLVALKTYFQQSEIKNKIIPIGLYCEDEEARQRIIGREDLTEEELKDIVDQINTLPHQISRYKKNPEQFRYLFYNHEPIITLDHLVDRAMGLFLKEDKYFHLSDSDFRQQYVKDQCITIFGMEPEELEERTEHGERVQLKFNEEDFLNYNERYDSVEIPDLIKASEREVVKVINAYGILNVLLDETKFEKLNYQERLGNRKIQQRLSEIKLGVPQYKKTGETIGGENISRIGLIQSGNSLLSFLISFSPYDIFPLVASQEYLPHVKTTSHTLSFESVYRKGKELVVQPLLAEDVVKYVNRNSGNGV